MDRIMGSVGSWLEAELGAGLHPSTLSLQGSFVASQKHDRNTFHQSRLL